MQKERRFTVKKFYRDLSPEARASYGITEDGSEESWVYCLTCGRAMPQGDCVVGEDGRLECAYGDCRPTSASHASTDLRAWDTLAQEQGGAAAHWPEKPEWGRRYPLRDADL